MAKHVATRSVTALLDAVANDVDLVDVAAAFRELVNRRNAADQALTQAVRAMRSRQASWSEIAVPLGVTRQSAQEKYGKAEKAVPVRTHQMSIPAAAATRNAPVERMRTAQTAAAAEKRRLLAAGCTCSLDYVGNPDVKRIVDRSCPVHAAWLRTPPPD